MARLWLDNPPRTGYESVLIEIELSPADRGKMARLVAAGHTYAARPSTGLHFAWVPVALAEAQINLYLEVELGRDQWVKVGPAYRLTKEDTQGTAALALSEV